MIIKVPEGPQFETQLDCMAHKYKSIQLTHRSGTWHMVTADPFDQRGDVFSSAIPGSSSVVAPINGVLDIPFYRGLLEIPEIDSDPEPIGVLVPQFFYKVHRVECFD